MPFPTNVQVQVDHPGFIVLNSVEEDVRDVFGETADHFGHDILALEIAEDHVYLFVQTHTKPSPSDTEHSPVDIAR